MNIIEKLGIYKEEFEPILMRRAEDSMCSHNSPDMLEALIYEIIDNGGANGQTIHLVKIVEKATNRSWEEIKELLK